MNKTFDRWLRPVFTAAVITASVAHAPAEEIVQSAPTQGTLNLSSSTIYDGSAPSNISGLSLIYNPVNAGSLNGYGGASSLSGLNGQTVYPVTIIKGGDLASQLHSQQSDLNTEIMTTLGLNGLSAAAQIGILAAASLNPVGMGVGITVAASALLLTYNSVSIGVALHSSYLNSTGQTNFARSYLAQTNEGLAHAQNATRYSGFVTHVYAGLLTQNTQDTLEAVSKVTSLVDIVGIPTNFGKTYASTLQAIIGHTNDAVGGLQALDNILGPVRSPQPPVRPRPSTSGNTTGGSNGSGVQTGTNSTPDTGPSWHPPILPQDNAPDVFPLEVPGMNGPDDWRPPISAPEPMPSVRPEPVGSNGAGGVAGTGSPPDTEPSWHPPMLPDENTPDDFPLEIPGVDPTEPPPIPDIDDPESLLPVEVHVTLGEVMQDPSLDSGQTTPNPRIPDYQVSEPMEYYDPDLGKSVGDTGIPISQLIEPMQDPSLDSGQTTSNPGIPDYQVSEPMEHYDPDLGKSVGNTGIPIHQLIDTYTDDRYFAGAHIYEDVKKYNIDPVYTEERSDRDWINYNFCAEGAFTGLEAYEDSLPELRLKQQFTAAGYFNIYAALTVKENLENFIPLPMSDSIRLEAKLRYERCAAKGYQIQLAK